MLFVWHTKEGLFDKIFRAMLLRNSEGRMFCFWYSNGVAGKHCNEQDNMLGTMECLVLDEQRADKLPKIFFIHKQNHARET